MPTVVVRSASDFAVLNNNTTYVFTKDIDLPLTAVPTYSGDGAGIIVDGSGYAITVVGPGSWGGLFTRPVTVRNLGIKSGKAVYPRNDHGIFFSYAVGGSATNCYSTGIIGSNGGGIFGAESGGTAINCYSTGIILPGGGGIFGCAGYGSATKCYSTGAICDTAGGIYGYASSGNATNCYSTGVMTTAGAGGIFAYACTGNATNCYSTGSILGGGGIFANYCTGAATNCYSTGNIAAGGGIYGHNGSGNITNCYTTGNVGNASVNGICAADFSGGTTSTLADLNDTWSDANAKTVLSNTPTVWYYKDGANKPWTFGTKPTAPTALTAVVTKNTAKLTWTAPVFLGPSVTYTLLQNGAPVSLANNKATTLSLTKLTPGASYTWSVAAVNSMGTSPAVSITKKLPLKQFPINSVIQKTIDF